MDSIGALRQGDDLGYKTATFLNPDHLRQYVFPIYKTMAQHAHNQDKPFILHSCGNLAAIYDDLIDGCKIDAKHSFEDVIMPVQDFKQKYGHRVTPLGRTRCRYDLAGALRRVAPLRPAKNRQCFEDGFWALGTGNSLTDYMPVENYLIVLEEGMKITA